MKLLLFLSLIPSCISLNILLFLIGTNQFERSTFEFLAQQLALRHHNVITVKPILIPEEPRLVKPKLHLVREKTIKNALTREFYQPLEKLGTTVWGDEYDEGAFNNAYWAAHNSSCYKLLNSNLMDTLKKDNIDVAIIYSGNPCQLAITHILAIPTIYFDTEGLSDETLVASGAPFDLNSPSSNCILPQFSCGSCGRFRNAACYLLEMISQSGISLISNLVSTRYRKLDGAITRMFAEDYSIKKRFNPFPDVNQLKQHSSLFFANTDPLLEYPRALPAHLIPVGGLHIDHPKPLFAPWNTTIEAAEEGLIVVSLGTQADSSTMTEKQAKSILNALSKLSKYRIYWRVGPNVKLPGIKEEDVPKHINLTAFLPQNDLLAHKSCRLLVTNGGMLSIMEAVAYGVPIVGIPLYGSNRHNLQKVVKKGLGLSVEKSDLTETSLLTAMRIVLESAKHKSVAKDMSKEFKSRPATPFNIALHYIEHVGRHHSAAFFAPQPQHPLRILQLEVVFILIILFFVIFYSTLWCCGLCFGRRKIPVTSETSKKEKDISKKESKKEK